MDETKVYTAERIFTGDDWLTDYAVITGNGMITGVVPVSELSSSQPVQLLDDYIIAPAFIDIQIYGAYGKLLSVYPEAASLEKLNEYSNKGGAAYCMPTVATNTKEVFYKSIDAIRDYWNKGGKGVLGLHLEGPWINPVKRGAHIELLIHPPTLPEVKELLEYGKGVIKIITLAPEVCPKEIIDCILSYNIILSAGHSNAGYQEAMQGFENGITIATHLYNAMSPLQHRQPGLVGAVMDHPSVMCSIIPDGHHVDYAAIRIAKQVMKERLFVITDAVTDTTEGPYPHEPAGDKYESAGILSGSSLTMNKAVQNLVHYACIELSEALRMCSMYPAKVLGLDQELGCIKQGYKASMVLLNDDLEVMSLL